ncbi:Rieske (2Fe-2S) protein [Nocardia elegans]|uniref:Rieske (2Fe-2S) protein n=1 Tax=Nocardia elegans TaxID=300029 RepID=A0ABW6TM06_9NOCA|nr:Rieske (2Fe-2S) protein [Nocardia elegans]MBF6450586.1 Rieske (2Fe-2S) protein [Nocardia elegans]
MSSKDVERYVDDILAGRSPRGFRPDDDDAAQIRAAIALRAARTGAGSPDEEFIARLHHRLSEDLDEPAADPGARTRRPTRRAVLIGTSVAAAAAAGGVIDHMVLSGSGEPKVAAAQQTLVPSHGTWQPVLASAELPDGATTPFDLGAVNGFLRRRDGVVYALSGICTHQGCKLWLDATAARLRCPCHSTSFGFEGEVVTHELPRTPAPLPRLQVREANGSIEVFAPEKPA